MASKCARLIVTALLAVFVLTAIAQAQSKPMTTPPARAELTRHASSGHPIQDACAVGWIYFHATNCAAYYASGVYYLVIYPAEGGYWYTSDVNFQHFLNGACQTGNWVALYITDTSCDWDEAFTFDYQVQAVY